MVCTLTELLPFLRLNVDGSSVGHEFPDFVNLRIGYRNASVCPVLGSMSGAQPSEAVGEAVDHNVATDRSSALGRSLFVLLIGIGNVSRLVEAALCVAAVEDVVTLGSLVISLLLFGANRRAPESYFVSPKNLPVRKQSQSALALRNDQLVRLGRGLPLPISRSATV